MEWGAGQEIMNPLTTIVLFLGTALTGILTGASLDQSIKQLPARHKIGALAFSNYARAADLGNGIVWYAALGLGAALSTLLVVILVWLNPATAPDVRTAATLAGVLAIVHTFTTTRAAPLYLGQKQVDDETALNRIFERFEFWQTIRAVTQTLNFIVLLYVVFLYGSAGA